MIALALLLQAAPLVPAPPAPPPAPPADWTVLPPLPLTQRLPDAEALSAYVKEEVAAGRCPAPPREPDGGWRMTVELALLVDKTGAVRRIVPRAIGCPTVEQYAVGVVARLARGGVVAPPADGWYRIATPFAWR